MNSKRLFHVSETAGIDRFVPRPVPSPDSKVSGEVVWAVDEEHLPNNLLPRDCPRVAFRLVESGWYDRIAHARLYVYELPPESFAVMDAGAGYFVSREAVMAKGVTVIENPLFEILRRGVELRFVESLWSLRDLVIQSSVEFSVIRFRNARPQ